MIGLRFVTTTRGDSPRAKWGLTRMELVETDDATVAAVFRAALMLGVATPADLVPWADGQIVARDRPAE